MRTPGVIVARLLALGAVQACATPPSPPDVDTDLPAAEPGLHVGLRRLPVRVVRRALADVTGVDALDGWTPGEDPRVEGFDHLDESVALSDLWVERFIDATERSAVAWSAAIRGAALPLQEPVTWSGEDDCGVESPWRVGAQSRVLWAPEPISSPITVPTAGRYELRVQAAHRATGFFSTGTEVGLKAEIDGQEVATWNLYGAEAPEERAAVVDLTAGPHTLTLAYTTPYTREAILAEQGTYACVTGSAVLVEAVALTGPLTPPPFGRDCSGTPEPLPCARATLTPLAERAWRRPVTEAEVTPAVQVVQLALRAGDGFEQALALGAQTVLLSPDFLYIAEQSPPGGPLTDLELATRLALGLWGTVPDDALRACAIAGRLTQHDDADCGLPAQTRRLIADARFEAFSEDLADAWLGLWSLSATGRPWPEGVDGARRVADMRAETIDLLASAVRNPLVPAWQLPLARTTRVSDDLAAHYGWPRGGEVSLDAVDPARPGLLGQAALLTLTSSAARSSPVKRGAYTLARLLCDPPDAPPPGIPALGGDLVEPGDVLDALAQHRNNPQCAGCHADIDPLGLPLEGYDLLGRARAFEAPPAALPDGTQLNDARALADWLASEPRHARCVAARAGTFLLGREISLDHVSTLEAWLQTAEGEGASWEALVRAIVTSPAFTHRAEASP